MILLSSCVWILSYIAEREDKTVPVKEEDSPFDFDLYRYQYAFYIGNICLGILSLLVYTLCRRDARLSWMKVCRCKPKSTSQRRNVKTSLVSNGNSSGNGNNRKSSASGILKADSGSDYTLVVERRPSAKTFMTEDDEKFYEHSPCASQTTGQRLAHHQSDGQLADHSTATSNVSSAWIQHNQHYNTIGGRTRNPTDYHANTRTRNPVEYHTEAPSTSSLMQSYNTNTEWMNHTKV